MKQQLKKSVSDAYKKHVQPAIERGEKEAGHFEEFGRDIVRVAKGEGGWYTSRSRATSQRKMHIKKASSLSRTVPVHQRFSLLEGQFNNSQAWIDRTGGDGFSLLEGQGMAGLFRRRERR